MRAVKRIFSHIPRPPADRRLRPLPGYVQGPLDLLRSAAFLGLARLRGAPGVQMHLRAAALGARLALHPGRLPQGYAIGLLLAPLDSVRYFEFDFCWRHVPTGARRYLDLSSPRLFPVLLLTASPRMSAELLNPDAADLACTSALVEACGLADRCTTALIAAAQAHLAPESFDLATSISVIEHIPAPGDAAAVRTLWEAVAPGGRLICTVPCAAEAMEEFVDLDEYGLQQPDASGHFFGQRFYDEALLDEVFFGTCGSPRTIEVFGEREPGTFAADRATKNAGGWQRWREPYELARGYRRFASIGQLPGVGVAAMCFEKSAG